jgi:hypothetical protein
MDESMVRAEVKPLSGWPTEHLSRAYRLAVQDVHDAVAQGRTADIAASEQEAAMFADELVRRGAL